MYTPLGPLKSVVLAQTRPNGQQRLPRSSQKGWRLSLLGPRFLSRIKEGTVVRLFRWRVPSMRRQASRGASRRYQVSQEQGVPKKRKHTQLALPDLIAWRAFDPAKTICAVAPQRADRVASDR